MPIVNTISPLTGRNYRVEIAGNEPTQEERVEIANWLLQTEGYSQPQQELIEPEEGGLGDVGDLFQGAASGFAKGFAQIPGGLASLYAAGMKYIPGDQGEEEVEQFGQSVTQAAESGIDYVLGTPADTIAGKSGQAIGSLASFFVPYLGAAKAASLAGAGVKATRMAGGIASGVMGVALGAQEQASRIQRQLEQGKEVDSKDFAVLTGGAIGATEALPLGKVFGAVGNILKKVPKEAKDEAIRTIRGRLKSAGKSAIAEGSQEVTAAILQDLTEKNLYNPDLNIAASAYTDDAIYGGGAGGVFNFVLESIAGRRINKFIKGQAQLVADQQEEGAEARDMANRGKASLGGTRFDADGNEIPEGQPQIAGPRLMLTGPDQEVEEDKQIVPEDKKRASENLKKLALDPAQERQIQIESARELQTGLNEIDLKDLPLAEAQIIRQTRQRRGSQDVDAPITLDELREVVGLDAYNREGVKQKPNTFEKGKTAEEAAERSEALNAKGVVLENYDAAVLAAESGEVTNKDGTISRAKLQRKLKVNARTSQAIIDEMRKRGVITPISPTKDRVVNPKEEPTPPSEEEIRIREYESAINALKVKHLETQSILERMKQNVQTPEDQIQVERVQAELDTTTAQIQSQENRLAEFKGITKPEVSAVQVSANEARKAQDEASDSTPTEDYRRKLNRIANALRKNLFKMGLSDVDLVTTNVIEPESIDTNVTEGLFENNADGRRIITLAMELYDPNMTDAELEQRLAGVMNHEVIHALKSLGLFSEAEWQTLVKAAQNRKFTKRSGGRTIEREYTFLDRAEYMYPDLDPEGQQEEAVAEMFRAYADGRLKVGGKPKGLFNRIIGFIKAIFNAHSEAGFRNAAEIFDGIKSGKVGRRERNLDKARQAPAESRYSTAGVRAGFLIPERGNVERIQQSFKDVTKRIPQLTEAAQKLSDGTILYDEYDRLVNEFKPIIPYETVPAPETNEDMLNALQASDPRKVEKLGQAVNIENGTRVKLRLDIPAYTRQGVWIPTIHGQDNRTIAHESTAIVTNAGFSASQRTAERIAVGGAKGPFATIDGSFVQASPEQAFAIAQQMMNDPDVVQVGFDPERHSYFYDRMTTQPVVGAEQVVQIGPLVLAKNPVFGNKSEFKYSVRRLPNTPENLLGPIPVVHDVKTRYLQSVGMPNRRQAEYVKVNEELARRIALAFEEAEDSPNNPDVREAYQAMADETMAQWQFIKDTGIKIEFIKPDMDNPYPNGSRDVLIDIRDNNHMWVFPTDSGFGEAEFTAEEEAANPLLSKVGEFVDGIDMRVNDVFRIVHDYFGHGLEGATFTARGEENAWQAHVRMYSGLAAKAMTTETRGQNSWVNFGPFGEQNRANPADTTYADQKMTLLPDFVVEEGVAADLESVNEKDRIAKESRRAIGAGATGPDSRRSSRVGTGQTDVGGEVQEGERFDPEAPKPAVDENGLTKLTHYSKIAGLEEIDPEKQGTNYQVRGKEYERKVGYPDIYVPRSYFGLNVGKDGGYDKEWSVGTNAYEVDVPIDGIYDLENDPKGYKSKAADMVTPKIMEYEQGDPERFVVTQAEKMIKEDGYAGYWGNSRMGLVAVMFNPLKVRSYNKADSEVKQSRRALPAGYADIKPLLLEDELELSESGMRHHVEQRTRKLVDIFNSLPSSEEMGAVAVAGKAKRGWYKNSAQTILDIFGLFDARRFTALLAATSPKTSVESNAINTLNIWANWNKAGRPKDRESILTIMSESVQGDKGKDSILPAWLNNSLRALTAPEGSEMELSLSGPKVNSFMLNLVGAVDEVTNDTWMANYALIDQGTFKGAKSKRFADQFGEIGVKSPGYIAFSAKVRSAANAASELTGDRWTPSEVQETVWSLAKALLEKRKSAGIDMSAPEMLRAGLITDVDVADVPDFETLFSNGLYSKILKDAGYEGELEAIRSRQRGGTRTIEKRPVYGTEDISVNTESFQAELDQFAERLETLARKKLDDSTKRSKRAVGAVPINFGRPNQPTINEAVGDVERAYDRITYNNVGRVLGKVFGSIPFISDETANRYTQYSERFLTKFQDSMLPVGKLMDELRADGYSVADAMDVYMREELAQGYMGAKLEANQQNLYEPLTENIRDLDISDADIARLEALSAFFRDASGAYDKKLAIADAYVYALHAAERNAYVLRKFQRGMGSGMSNEEAQAIINWVNSLDVNSRAGLQSINQLVKEIIESTNNERREGGLMADEYQFDNYVPLRGLLDPDSEFAEESNNLPLPGRRRRANLYGGRVRQDPQIREGRGEQYATDIIANVMTQNQRTIVDAERNKVGKSFLDLIESQEVDMTGIASVVDSITPENENNILKVKINGRVEPVKIFINDDRIARAMKGAYGDGTTRSANYVKYLRQFNRFLSNLNTTWNPEFVITNFARDLGTVGVNVNQYEESKIVREVVANALPAIKGIASRIDAPLAGDTTEWSQIFDDFVKAGGKNSTNQIDTVKDQMENIQRILKTVGESGSNVAKARAGFRELGRWLDTWNTAVENGVRVATYKALLDRGYTKDRAAQAARNVTVNFAKGGEEKMLMNSLYLFYNASIQGSFALMNAAIKSGKVRKIWAGMLLYSILADQINALLSDDEDEDGKKDYDELTDYTLEHNLIFPTLGLTKEGFVKIPLGYGINMAFNSGRVMSRFMRGEYSIGDASNSFFGTIFESMSPIGSINDFGELGDYGNLAAPTVFDPFVSLLANRDYDGTPIYKPGSPYGLQKPDNQMYWANVGATPKVISNILSIYGTEVTPGFIDISPNVVDFWINYLTGGAGSFVVNVLDLPNDIVNKMRGDFEGNITREIPFVKKIFTSPSAQAETGDFMEYRDEVLRAVQELKYARMSGDTQRIESIKARYAKELSIAGRIKALNNYRNKLVRQKNKIRQSPRIPEEQKKALIRKINERITEVVRNASVVMRDAGVM